MDKKELVPKMPVVKKEGQRKRAETKGPSGMGGLGFMNAFMTQIMGSDMGATLEIIAESTVFQEDEEKPLPEEQQIEESGVINLDKNLDGTYGGK